MLCPGPQPSSLSPTTLPIRNSPEKITFGEQAEVIRCMLHSCLYRRIPKNNKLDPGSLGLAAAEV